MCVALLPVRVLGQAGPVERTFQDIDQEEIMALPLHHPDIDPALLIPPVLPLEQNAPNKPIKTTVCELLENPQRFLDRLFEIGLNLSVRARFCMIVIVRERWLCFCPKNVLPPRARITTN